MLTRTNFDPEVIAFLSNHRDIETVKIYINQLKNKDELDFAKLMICAILCENISAVELLCKAGINPKKNYSGIGVPFHCACLVAKNGSIDVLARLLEHCSFSTIHLPIPERDNMNALEAAFVDKKFTNVMFFLLEGANPFAASAMHKSFFELTAKLELSSKEDGDFSALLRHIEIIEALLSPVLSNIFNLAPTPKLIVELLEYICDEIFSEGNLDQKSLSSDLAMLICTNKNFGANLNKLISFTKENKKTKLGNLGELKPYISFSRRFNEDKDPTYRNYVYDKLRRLISNVYANNIDFFLSLYNWEVTLGTYNIFKANGESIIYESMQTSNTAWLPINQVILNHTQGFLRLRFGIMCQITSDSKQALEEKGGKFVENKICTFKYNEENILFISMLMERHSPLDLLIKLDWAITNTKTVQIAECLEKINNMVNENALLKKQKLLLLDYLKKIKQASSLMGLKNSVAEKTITSLINILSFPSLKDITLGFILKNNISYREQVPSDLIKECDNSRSLK